MGNEILQKIHLSFEPENKEKVKEVIERMFDKFATITRESHDFIEVETSGEDDEASVEDNYKEMKRYCTQIIVAEYEFLEIGGFNWEQGDDE